MKKVKIIPTNKDSLLCFNIEKSSSYIPNWYKESKQKIKGYDKTRITPGSTRHYQGRGLH